MKRFLTGEPNNPDRKYENITRSPNHYLDYDFEEEVSTIVDREDLLDVFDDMLGRKQKDTSPFFTRGL